MRYLLLALLLVSCSQDYKPKFKVGDCLADKATERWERPDLVYKVLEVGKKSYHIAFTRPPNDFSLDTTDSFWLMDDYKTIVDCPEIFQ